MLLVIISYYIFLSIFLQNEISLFLFTIITVSVILNVLYDLKNDLKLGNMS